MKALDFKRGNISILFLFLFGMLLAGPAIAQYQGKVSQEVFNKKVTHGDFDSYQIFSTSTESARTSYSDAVRDGVVFDLERELTSSIRSTNPWQMRLTIPFYDGSTIDLDLYRVKVLSDDYRMMAITGDGSNFVDVTDQVDLGVHYRGVIAGNVNSLVSISIFDSQVSGFIADANAKYTLGKLTDSDTRHILYNDRDLLTTYPFNCDMPDDENPYSHEDLNPSVQRDAGDCIKVMWLGGFDLYTALGSDIVAYTQYRISLAAEAYTIYANQGVWMEDAPSFVYTSDEGDQVDTDAYLNYFQGVVPGTQPLTGDIGHYIELHNVGGLAAGFDGLCNADVDESLCFSGLSGTAFNNVPTYSFNVYITTHEMGHVVGSRHTHACVWNGDNTAIDGCSGSVDFGPCPLPPPASPGTIMSYCNPDVTMTFHPQPLQAIMNDINAASCLEVCPCNPDITAPTALCQNVTVQLNGSGNASTSASAVNNGSFDGCSGVSLSLSKTTFDCDDVPGVGVTLTVTDDEGNSSNCAATVFVQDNIPPTALCKNITVELDAFFGTASIVPTDIDNGSSDNCSILSYEFGAADGLNEGIYDCSDLGPNPEVLVVTDPSGNQSICNATVTVVDVTPPTALCQNITRYLEFGTCDLSVDPLEIDDGSFDNCSIVLYELDPNSFDEGDVGDQPVVLTVTDQSGNSSTCSATVTILRRPTTLTNLGVFDGQYSDYPEISALLIDVLTGLPVPGKDIDFELAEGTQGDIVDGGNVFGAIPDGGTFCDVITVSGADGNLTDARVHLDITHTWIGDLTITLTSPEGTTITLLERPGLDTPTGCCGCSDNNIPHIDFFDASTNGVSTVEDHCGVNPAAWNTGLPNGQPVNVFSTLAGESANGDWTLCVSDGAGLDVGTLDYWHIVLEWASTARGIASNTFESERRTSPADYYERFASIDEDHKRSANERVTGINQAPPPANATTIFLTATTNANGIATINPRLGYNQPPTILGYEYIITSIFPDDDPCYVGSRDDDVFTVLQEDARVTYTGKNFASTQASNSNKATVLLAATVCDISSTPDAGGDTDPGDISNATVTFVDRDNGNAPISPPLEVVQVPNDSTKGTVSFVWLVDIGFAECKTFNIGIVVGNYYTRDDAADDQEIEICRPGNCKVNGGGWFELQNSFGSVPGEAGTHCNFGMVANAQGRNNRVGGHVNIIYRQLQFDGLHDIQIQSLSVVSLGLDLDNDFAEFCGSGRVRDVTTGAVLYPAGSFLVKVQDNGNPGQGNDLVAFAFYAPDGELVFSSNWTGTFTDMTLLNGGNVHVHCPGNPNARDIDAAADDERVTGFEAEAYPNPFSDAVQVAFTLPEAGRTIIEVISLSGEVITTDDLGMLDRDIQYIWDFEAGSNLSSGNYMYRITSGDHIVNGKLLYLK